jgi:hypothetical protein
LLLSLPGLDDHPATLGTRPLERAEKAIKSP